MKETGLMFKAPLVRSNLGCKRDLAQIGQP